MSKPKSPTLLECINCESRKVIAGSKVENATQSGWKRTMFCKKCECRWTQYYQRGVAFQREDDLTLNP